MSWLLYFFINATMFLGAALYNTLMSTAKASQKAVATEARLNAHIVATAPAINLVNNGGTIGGSVTVDGNHTVTGNQTVDGTGSVNALNVNGSNATISSSGHMSLTAIDSVNGNASIDSSGNLSVNAISSINGNASVSGAGVFNGSGVNFGKPGPFLNQAGCSLSHLEGGYDDLIAALAGMGIIST